MRTFRIKTREYCYFHCRLCWSSPLLGRCKASHHCQLRLRRKQQICCTVVETAHQAPIFHHCLRGLCVLDGLGNRIDPQNEQVQRRRCFQCSCSSVFSNGHSCVPPNETTAKSFCLWSEQRRLFASMFASTKTHRD